MNARINNGKNFMKQTGHVCITWSLLFLFIVMMRMQVQADTYEYDDLNRVTKVIYDDQSYTVYEYDANGNIKSQNHYENKGNEPESGEKPGGETPGSGEKPEGETPGTGDDTESETPETGGNTIKRVQRQKVKMQPMSLLLYRIKQ